MRIEPPFLGTSARSSSTALVPVAPTGAVRPVRRIVRPDSPEKDLARARLFADIFHYRQSGARKGHNIDITV